MSSLFSPLQQPSQSVRGPSKGGDYQALNDFLSRQEKKYMIKLNLGELPLQIPTNQSPRFLKTRRDKSTAKCSPIDSGTPLEREVQAELTGERQLSTYRSEDTALPVSRGPRLDCELIVFSAVDVVPDTKVEIPPDLHSNKIYDGIRQALFMIAEYRNVLPKSSNFLLAILEHASSV
ncbi:unnamed protein product [Caretta caretta]